MDLRGTIGTVALVLSLTACGGAGSPGAAPSPRGSDVDALLEGFPPCAEPSPGKEARGVRGLLLPPDSVVHSVRRRGPITTVQGFVGLTPVEVREHYEGDPKIQIIVSEDEFVESELLFTNGRFRNFVKARASCREGSDIVTVISREMASLPTPAGSAGPGASPSTSPAP